MRRYSFAAIVALLGCDAPHPVSPPSVAPTTTSTAPFDDAVNQVAKLTGAVPEAGKDPSGEPLPGVVLFRLKGEGAALFARNQAALRSSGAFLFLYMHGFGAHGDVVGLSPTTDKFDVVQRTRTDGANPGHDNAAVIQWLREIDHDEPFQLTGAGPDFVEGTFDAPVQQPAKLARSIQAFCPDFWNQGIGLNQTGDPDTLIAQYFSSPTNRDFFFWWD